MVRRFYDVCGDVDLGLDVFDHHFPAHSGGASRFAFALVRSLLRGWRKLPRIRTSDFFRLQVQIGEFLRKLQNQNRRAELVLATDDYHLRFCVCPLRYSKTYPTAFGERKGNSYLRTESKSQMQEKLGPEKSRKEPKNRRRRLLQDEHATTGGALELRSKFSQSMSVAEG